MRCVLRAPKCAKMRLRPGGLCPDLAESLQCSSRPHSWIWGKEWEGKEIKGRKGRRDLECLPRQIPGSAYADAVRCVRRRLVAVMKVAATTHANTLPTHSSRKLAEIDMDTGRKQTWLAGRSIHCCDRLTEQNRADRGGLPANARFILMLRRSATKI